ncbi:pleckstrin homology domain-containing family G member 3-like [Paramormyrops kingsleyae]|uniref:pleckstrin homology domain-containing family G member 3-like n=1 Tax=Paramormyrops kingsleyae TaxID=1676925 RepID=UPI003B9739FF
MPEWSVPSAVPMGEESPRLSTGSSFSSECLSTSTVSESSVLIGGDLPDNGRPVSLVSTLSSSSSSSKEEHCLYRSSTQSIDLEPGPAGKERPAGLEEGSAEGAVQKNNKTVAPLWADQSIQVPCSSPEAQTMAPGPQITYLDRVVMEIVETERMYVRDLRGIVEDYLAHIIDTTNLPILPEQVGALFGNIEDIYEFNSELLQSLDMCENDAVAIARCFVHKTEYFEIYTQYCTNYPNSVAVLTECMSNKTLSNFFHDRQAMLKHPLPLGSYLLKPVQRILKYHLLLQEIAKHFNPEEEGYEVVEEAIYTMTGVAWYINDMKRKHEHAVRLQEVQSLLINWKGPDLTTYGELVLEGTFRVHHSKNERTLFLFEKMLLITKKHGEHYVYKTHISCSTLMLIESAKDSLCFSVMHYRYPKQPHTVQAKTAEERKLWAHHIKRLILENHQAIIPQKAKDALQMDSAYPKYRYSPERLKKAMSCQPDDVTVGVHVKRRQSEPAKQIIQSIKDTLKVRQGPLLYQILFIILLMCGGAMQVVSFVMLMFLCIMTYYIFSFLTKVSQPHNHKPLFCDSTLQPSGVGRTLLDAPLSLQTNTSAGEEGIGLHDPEAEGSHKEEEKEMMCQRESSDESGLPASKVEKEWESDSDDILMEDDQMDDFASSMLAAISSWHYRVRALLSNQATMDNEEDGILEENKVTTENLQTSYQHELGVTPLDLSQPHQAASNGPVPDSHDTQPGLPERHEPDLTRSDLLVLTRTTPITPKVPKIPGSSSSQNAEKRKQREKKRATQQDGVKSVSSEQSSESEEEENVAAPESESDSILPSSVLNQAAVIVEHFINSTRRGSLHSVGGPCQKHVSRSGSTMSMSTDFLETVQRLHNNPVETRQNLCNQDSTTTNCPKANNLFEGSGIPMRRQDSSLSRQDQLLIDKIRCYYENAEYKEADFSRTRRESLTSIPTGLVQTSVSQLNSIPKDEALARETKCAAIGYPSTSSISTPSEVIDTSGLDKTQQPIFFGFGAKSCTSFEDIVPGSQIESLVIFEKIDGCVAPRKILGHSVNLDEDLTRGHTHQGRLSRPVHLQMDFEEDRQMQDEEKAKTTVFQLARQYSQRMKTTRKSVQNNPDLDDLHDVNLPSVLEERPETENRALPRSPSPQDRSPSLSCPMSAPSSTQTEGFHWPDVRELCSRYSFQGEDHAQDCLQASSGTLGRGPRRHSSSSSSFSGSQTAVYSEAVAYKPQRWESCQGKPQMCRAGSPEHRLCELPGPRATENAALLTVQTDGTELYEAPVWRKKDKHTSPTCQGKISAMADIEHSSSNWDSEREGGRVIGALAVRCGESRENDHQSDLHEQYEDTENTGNTETDTGQQSNVKNLREKFLSMTSNVSML